MDALCPSLFSEEHPGPNITGFASANFADNHQNWSPCDTRQCIHIVGDEDASENAYALLVTCMNKPPEHPTQLRSRSLPNNSPNPEPLTVARSCSLPGKTNLPFQSSWKLGPSEPATVEQVLEKLDEDPGRTQYLKHRNSWFGTMTTTCTGRTDYRRPASPSPMEPHRAKASSASDPQIRFQNWTFEPGIDSANTSSRSSSNQHSKKTRARGTSNRRRGSTGTIY